METPNQLKATRRKGKRKRCQHRDSKGVEKDPRADKPTEMIEVRERGVKPGEALAKIRKSRWNLMFSLRGSVEIQDQHWAHKPVRKPVLRLGA